MTFSDFSMSERKDALPRKFEGDGWALTYSARGISKKSIWL